MHRLRKLELPPVYMALFAALMWALNRLAPFWQFDLPDGVAFSLIGVGLLMICASALPFFLQKTPIEPRRRARTLIVSGLYRFSRNPIYLAFTLMLLGYALYLGSLSALVPPFIYPVLITRRFILGEEQLLAETFGPAYLAYKEKVRRWL